MYANSAGRMSMDSISPSSPHSRNEFPFYARQGSTVQRQRRDSYASSIHSIGGSLDTSGWANSVAESQQNAISTLLQPPIVRTGLLPHTSAPTSGHRMPTSRDIQPVTLTNITRVDAAEFRPYLAQVGALYEQLRRAKEHDDDADQQRGQKGSKGEDQAPEDDSHLRPGAKKPGTRRKSSVSSVRSMASLTSPVDPPTPIRRSSSSFARRAAQGPPPLSTIPNVYLDEDFRLENPRTFDVVSERSEVISKTPAGAEDNANGNAAPRKALATNAILQEKLSWYMDTVEMHLIASISAASTTFFTALGSLKELHVEAAESVDRIKNLRQELEALDVEIVAKGLDIVQQRRRRENLQQLHSAVLQLRDIVDGVARCEAQVEEGNVDDALGELDSLELLIAGHVEPFTGFNRPVRLEYALRDLSGAAALQGVNDDMNTLRYRIGKIYETRLVELLLGDLRRHVGTVSNQEVMMRWSTASNRGKTGHGRDPSAFPSYMAKQDSLREALPSILDGLQRARHLSAATAAYRDFIMREIRAIIKKHLPSSNEDDNESMMSSSTRGGGMQRTQQQKSSMLARNLRNLEREDAEELLVKIYLGVTETLRRATTQGKLLLDVASSIGDDTAGPDGLKSPPLRSPPFSPPHQRASVAGIEAQEEIHKALELSNLLGQAVDVAQDKIVKLLRVRTEQSTHLPLVWFLRYFTLNLHFATECESISGRSGTTLKTVVNGQIKEFVQLHGDFEKQKLAQGMEQDQWAARDFTEKDQDALDIILQCETKDPAAWTDGSKVWIPLSELNGGDTKKSAESSEGTGEKENGAATGKAKVRGAIIEGETSLIPNSAVLCLEGVSNFLHLAVAIPSMAADVAASLVAYLQLFNSRCTQLILGAGATRSAGLKNITTKHLATASQALGFMATLVPHVREFVRRHVPGADKPSGSSSSSSSSSSSTTTLIGEFDKVKRQYQEHQNSIYDKLVEIMSGRAAIHSKTMRTIVWDEGGEVHPYMDTLGRETSTLHRNLTKTLPDSTVRFIMAPVFASYKEAFGKVLVGAEIRTEEGRESMVRDFEYFQVKLGKIEGFGDTANHLLDIIHKKKLEGGGDGRKKDLAADDRSKNETRGEKVG